MKKLPRNFSKIISSVFSEKRLFKTETPGFLPFYHVVSNEKLPHILNYPYRNVEQFEAELDYYLRYFKPVGLEDFANKKNKTKNIFHLSFDDGLRECHEVIAPVLLKKGIPATFFVNTAFIDNKKLFHKYKTSLILSRLKENPDEKALKFLADHGFSTGNILKAEKSHTKILDKTAGILKIDFNEFLSVQKPYLTSEQIKELAQSGFTIGAHSHTHPEFYRIPEDEQLHEIKTSMQLISELVNPAIRAFSFPFTDHGVSGRVLRALKDENICDITFGTAGVKNDSVDFHFQRYPVEQSGSFVRNLKGEFIYYKLRKLAGKATVKH